MSSFIPRNLTEIQAVAECTFVCICNTAFRMFSCLQINCQPFYLRQLLKFHLSDWLIKIYLQTEGQGTHHKMVSLLPMPGFAPLFQDCIDKGLNFTIKEVCDRVHSPEDQFFNIKSCKWLSTSSLKSFSRF